jgi:hypothetical protein
MEVSDVTERMQNLLSVESCQIDKPIPDKKEGLVKIINERREFILRKDYQFAERETGCTSSSASKYNGGRIRILTFLDELTRTYQGPLPRSSIIHGWISVFSYMRPGKPVDNTFIESSNGKLRGECLNEH